MMVLRACNPSHRACKQSLCRLMERRGGEEGGEEVAHENLEFFSLNLPAREGEQEIVVSE